MSGNMAISNMIFSVTGSNQDTCLLKRMTDTISTLLENENNSKHKFYYHIDRFAGVLIAHDAISGSSGSKCNWVEIGCGDDKNSLYNVIVKYLESKEYLALLAARPIPQYNDDSTYGKGWRIFHPNPYARYGWDIYRYASNSMRTDEFMRGIGQEAIGLIKELVEASPDGIIRYDRYEPYKDGFSLWDIDFIIEPFACEYHK